jgi:hypothetical protein
MAVRAKRGLQPGDRVRMTDTTIYRGRTGQVRAVYPWTGQVEVVLDGPSSGDQKVLSEQYGPTRTVARSKENA